MEILTSEVGKTVDPSLFPMFADAIGPMAAGSQPAPEQSAQHPERRTASRRNGDRRKTKERRDSAVA
jgi:hypothetical protein